MTSSELDTESHTNLSTPEIASGVLKLVDCGTGHQASPERISEHPGILYGRNTEVLNIQMN